MSLGTGSDPVKIFNWERGHDERIYGQIVGHPTIGSGKGCTSPVVSQNGDLVTTQSGTVYRLCNPSDEQKEKDRAMMPATRTCCKCGTKAKPGNTRCWIFRDGEWVCDKCWIGPQSK